MNAALLTAALLLGTAPFDALGLNEQDQARLEKGEVVVRGELYKTPEGKNAGRGKAWILIQRSADESFAVLTAYEKHPEFMPRLRRVNVLERTPDSMRVVHEVKIVLSTVRYTLDLAIDRPARTMSFALDKTAANDIRDTSGEWRLLEAGEGRTLVQYTVAVDSGMSVPSFLEDYLTRRDLPRILESFRRRVESDGSWKK